MIATALTLTILKTEMRVIEDSSLSFMSLLKGVTRKRRGAECHRAARQFNEPRRAPMFEREARAPFINRQSAIRLPWFPIFLR
jgi:hypothetical protein